MTSQADAKAWSSGGESGGEKEGAQIVATHGAIVNYGSTRSNGDGKEGKKHEGSDESGKNIVFDNQTENVHSLSQNKANKMPTTTATTQCGVAKGAEKEGKNTNTHARVCVLVCVLWDF